MLRMIPFTHTCIAFSLAASLLLPATSHAESETAPAVSADYVSNLAYGNSLYHFFQEKYFSAITDLLVAKHYQRLNTEDKNAELLLGGMYLSYGLPDKASGIFNELLDQSTATTSQDVRDRARFHLGKHYYETDIFQPAESALTEIGTTLSKDYDAEKSYMLINILIGKKRLDQATAFLGNIPPDSIWHDYAQFNIGAALIRENRFDEGAELLNEIGAKKAITLESQIIKDKANIALAFAEIARNHPALAGHYFSRVRINGSQTGSGLLGLGWSWYKLAFYKEALNAWLALSTRPEVSIAKQEALITIPYAYENAGQPWLALDAYDVSINSYNQELKAIHNIIRDINSGKFVQSLKTVSLGTESSNPISVIDKADTESNRYLYNLFMSRDFHNAVRDLQELVFLSYTLHHWEQDIPALRLILEEKRLTYNREIGKQDHKRIINQARVLFEQRNALAAQVKQLESEENILALATDHEKELLDKLHRAKQTLAAANTSELDAQKQKIHLLDGLMTWKLTSEFPARSWQTRKELNALDKTAQEFNKTIVSLSDIFATRPAQYADHLARIKIRETELQQLKLEIATAIKEQDSVVTRMALDAANNYASKIETYLDRALYSRARLYDALTIPQAAAP